MNNADFGKTIKNVRKHRGIQLVTTERRRNYLVSEPNYHTTKFFTDNLLAQKFKKQININKPVYSEFSVLKLSKTVIHEFWYDYVKPKYGEKATLRYVDTDTVYIKTDDIYKDLAEDVETRCDTLNYEFRQIISKTI